MVRTQLYLDDEIHRRLRAAAQKHGRTVSDLVREALDRVYGDAGHDERLITLEGIDSLWRGREDLPDTRAYVRQLRRDTRPRKRSP
ncbi:MAG: ribbon-helix-helix protein, CopG family [Longimicrobiales bacterium]